MPTKSSEIPLSPCPECGHVIEWATGDDGREPLPTDWCVCLECTAILRFTDDLGLRQTTLLERSDAPEELTRVVSRVAQMLRPCPKT